MAPWSMRPMAVFVVAVVLAAAAAAPASAADCARDKKITVQNLCAEDLKVTLTRLANSDALFGPGTTERTLRHGTHESFPVCWWTGRLQAPGSSVVEFHVGVDGGSFYLATNAQAGQKVPVTVAPHGSPLQGRCPAVGCDTHGKCSVHQVPSGDCRNVQEIKIIYCNPHV